MLCTGFFPGFAAVAEALLPFSTIAALGVFPRLCLGQVRLDRRNDLLRGATGGKHRV